MEIFGGQQLWSAPETEIIIGIIRWGYLVTEGMTSVIRQEFMSPSPGGGCDNSLKTKTNNERKQPYYFWKQHIIKNPKQNKHYGTWMTVNWFCLKGDQQLSREALFEYWSQVSVKFGNNFFSRAAHTSRGTLWPALMLRPPPYALEMSRGRSNEPRASSVCFGFNQDLRTKHDNFSNNNISWEHFCQSVFTKISMPSSWWVDTNTRIRIVMHEIKWTNSILSTHLPYLPHLARVGLGFILSNVIDDRSG